MTNILHNARFKDTFTTTLICLINEIGYDGCKDNPTVNTIFKFVDIGKKHQNKDNADEQFFVAMNIVRENHVQDKMILSNLNELEKIIKNGVCKENNQNQEIEEEVEVMEIKNEININDMSNEEIEKLIRSKSEGEEINMFGSGVIRHHMTDEEWEKYCSNERKKNYPETKRIQEIEIAKKEKELERMEQDEIEIEETDTDKMIENDEDLANIFD